MRTWSWPVMRTRNDQTDFFTNRSESLHRSLGL